MVITRVPTTPPDSKRSSRDLIEVLATGEPPAFANDAAHRIVFWNKGAEELVGRSAAQTLGRLCHEVFRGRDPFGNRFCAETCAVTTSLAAGEPIRRFEVTAGDQQNPQLLGFTVVQYPDAATGSPIAVHMIDEATPRQEPSHEVERLATARPSTTPQPSARRAVKAGQLSAREREVLRAIAAGRPNKEIASKLGISVATARNHVQHILQKLGVHSCLLYTSPSPRDRTRSRMPSSA